MGIVVCCRKIPRQAGSALRPTVFTTFGEHAAAVS